MKPIAIMGKKEARMGDMYIRRGQVVFGSHGAMLGHVLQADESGFVVEKGLVFTEDYPVRYEDVESVRDDVVRLRIPGDALVSEEEARPWEPARDPDGTAGGTDIEPLRAGMAEIEEHQRAERVGAGPERAPAPAPTEAPRRGERRRPALAREARVRPRTRAGAKGSAQAIGQQPATQGPKPPGDSEFEQHIKEEIEDFEREASCSESRAGDDPLLEARRATPPAPVPKAAGPARSHGAARKRPPGFGRVDYRAAAPEALKAMARLEAYVRNCGLERRLLELVKLRASQMNGCGYCIDMHTKDARREGETEQRLYTLQVWDETRFFTDRERAALAWTEAVTRLGPDRVGDAVFQQAREQFSETELVNLTMATIAINGWNRLAIAFRTEPGSYQPREERSAE